MICLRKDLREAFQAMLYSNRDARPIGRFSLAEQKQKASLAVFF